jgi:1,4-dihydroxy-6-naphthoate synthase
MESSANSLVYSTCPNDTFVFHAWAHGLLDAPPVAVEYADIDITNTAAERGEYDIVKVSYAALPWLLDRYTLLPSGGALGRGCGPLVLTRDELPSLDGRSVAVPSERSTAYLLFRLWATGQRPSRIEVVPFSSIMPGVRDGRYDAGLVIHEARFTYHEYGLTSMVDLGAWWESDTGLPIPLGAILAKRGLDAAAMTRAARESVEYAWANPDASADYIAKHAQEMSPDVQRRHIDLYVNEFSRDLGDEGFAAVGSLLDRAYQAGLIPSSPTLR